MNRNPAIYHSLLFIARLALGGFFIVSGIFKIIYVADFARAVANYKILATPLLVNLVAVTLPWIEFLAGLLLVLSLWHHGDHSVFHRPAWLSRFSWEIFRHTHRGALTILSGLLVFFIIVMAVTIFRGIDTNCGCIDPRTSSRLGWTTIIRDGMLLIPVLFLYLAPRLHRRIQSLDERDLTPVRLQSTD